MVRKCSRVEGSHNCYAIGSLNQYLSPEFSMTVDISNQSSLSLSSPPVSYQPDHRGLFQYLDSCYQCQKKFDLSQDIFMYRDFAFCCTECRDAKIAIDAVAQDPGQPRGGN